MEQLRIQIWDHIYRSGPQSTDQISSELNIDVTTVVMAVEHEWFERLDSIVQIAVQKPADKSGFDQ
ncbi:MAG: hypothetical protein KDB27_09580 [Planctomycetales bacterium]|nr:hypothetical protein [Planctomycetales bacterium]